MNNPIRVQRSRKKGYKLPENTVCVSRGTKYGNPFIVVEKENLFYVEFKDENLYGRDYTESFQDKKDAIACMLECYKEIISCEHNLGKINIFDLKGKNLACWCKLDEPCHADFLLKLVNEDQK